MFADDFTEAAEISLGEVQKFSWPGRMLYWFWGRLDQFIASLSHRLFQWRGPME